MADLNEKALVAAVVAYEKSTGAERYQTEGWIESALSSAISAYLSALTTTSGDDEALAWWHEIVEASGWKGRLLSKSPENPWSQWLEEHRDECEYTCIPLYARPQSAAVRDEATIRLAHHCQSLVDVIDDVQAMCGDIVDEEDMEMVRHIEADASDALHSTQSATVKDGFQDRVAKAHHALFHDDPTDIAERASRFFEESCETFQAFDMTKEDAHALVDYVFSRPVGERDKEVGAAALTLASLCIVAEIDMMACAEADLEKLQRPETVARIRAKRATRHGRGSLPGFDPALHSTQEG